MLPATKNLVTDAACMFDAVHRAAWMPKRLRRGWLGEAVHALMGEQDFVKEILRRDPCPDPSI